MSEIWHNKRVAFGGSGLIRGVDSLEWKSGLIREVDSLEWNNLVVFYSRTLYLKSGTIKGWPYKRGTAVLIMRTN